MKKIVIKDKKKFIILSVAVVLAITLAVTGIIFGVRAMKIKNYEEMNIRLPARFTITAHTGCLGTKDNSVESMRAGVANGAQIIEFDVHFTEDGTPVLAHDAPKGDELKLDVAFEFLARNKNIKANVDMKSVDNMQAVKKLATEYGVTKQIFFTGIGLDDVDAVKKLGISYYLNVSVDKKQNTDKDYLTSLVEEVRKAGAIGINFNYESASSELVQAFRVNNLLVSIWTVDDTLDMYEILMMSPDNITTRNPDKLSEIIKK